MKELTPQDVFDLVVEDLTARHMLGEPDRALLVDAMEAAHLCSRRDHRGRTVSITYADAHRALVIMSRQNVLATADGRRFTLPRLEPVPVLCDVVAGKLANVRPMPPGST